MTSLKEQIILLLHSRAEKEMNFKQMRKTIVKAYTEEADKNLRKDLFAVAIDSLIAEKSITVENAIAKLLPNRTNNWKKRKFPITALADGTDIFAAYDLDKEVDSDSSADEDEEEQPILYMNHNNHNTSIKPHLSSASHSVQNDHNHDEDDEEYQPPLRSSSVIKGHFSPEEDTIILDRLRGMSDKDLKYELTAVAISLNRPRQTIKERAKILMNIKADRTPTVFWTPEMDMKLTEAVNTFGTDWIAVGAYVANGKSNMACCTRWFKHVSPDLAMRNKEPWTDAEVQRLQELVAINQTMSRSKVSTNWTVVSKEMNRYYEDCADKWKSILTSTMKRGRYTPEEDEYILKRVKEWGNKGKGIWAALQGEMDRSKRTIQKRWMLNLSKKTNLLDLMDNNGTNLIEEIGRIGEEV